MKGWPTLGELRNKFIFVLSGRGFEESTKQRQATYESVGKYAFIDIDQRYGITGHLPVLFKENSTDWRRQGIDATG